MWKEIRLIDFLLFSFLDNFDRISGENFTPNNDDLLRVRIRTTGIVQEDFQFNHVRLRYEYFSMIYI
jgi:hypothetical protein